MSNSTSSSDLDISPEAKGEACSHVTIGGATLPLENTLTSRVASPMAYLQGSCDVREMATLWRWVDAKQLCEGNRAVIMLDGHPRGRFRRAAADGITAEAYARYEIEAYRWIVSCFLRGSAATQAEYFARMVAGSVEKNIVEWGGLVANSDDLLIALGAAVGSTRSLAWHLEQGYAYFAEMYRMRKKGCSFHDAESRMRSVVTAVQLHRVSLAPPKDL